MPVSLSTDSISDDKAKCLEAIARVAACRDIETFLVGGMVRDMVAGRAEIATSPDITTIGDAAALADALIADLPDCHLISVSQLHTAKVRIGAQTVDISSARTDTYEAWGALPRITLVDDIEADLSRRDFTVNAMAVRLQSSGLGELIDPYNGRADIADGTLRVIHDDSFREDPLRMLRGARLAARYGYTFETHTSELLRQSLSHLREMIETSPTRVFNEFRLWFKPHENLEVLTKIAMETGLLSALGVPVDLPNMSLNRVPPDASELQRFAAFVYNFSEEIAGRFVHKLKMPSEWRAVAQDATSIQRLAQRFKTERISDVQLHRTLINIDNQVLQATIPLECNVVATKRLEDFQKRLRHIRTSLGGNDLIALGVEQGPMVGQLLDELLERRIQGKITSVADERRHIIRRLSGD